MSATRRSNCICRQSLLMQQAQFPRTYPLPAHQAHPGSPRIGAEHARQDKVQSGDEPPLLGPDDRVASVHGEGRSSSLDARLGGGKLPSPRGFIAQLPITSHNSRDGRQAAPALGSGRDSEHTAISTAAEGGGQRPATVTVRSPRPTPQHKRARGERGRDAAQTAVAALKTSALPKSPRPCGSPLQSPAASRLRAVGATGGSAPREWRAHGLSGVGHPGHLPICTAAWATRRNSRGFCAHARTCGTTARVDPPATLGGPAPPPSHRHGPEWGPAPGSCGGAYAPAAC